MTAIVDASVAVKWFLLEPKREPAKQLLDGGERLAAPELILAEVANALWRRVILGESDPGQAGATAASLPRFFSRLFGLTPLADRAVECAGALNRFLHVVDFGHAGGDAATLLAAGRFNDDLFMFLQEARFRIAITSLNLIRHPNVGLAYDAPRYRLVVADRQRHRRGKL